MKISHFTLLTSSQYCIAIVKQINHSIIYIYNKLFIYCILATDVIFKHLYVHVFDYLLVYLFCSLLKYYIMPHFIYLCLDVTIYFFII